MRRVGYLLMVLFAIPAIDFALDHYADTAPLTLVHYVWWAAIMVAARAYWFAGERLFKWTPKECA